MSDLARDPYVVALAWTLVHFVWQGAAIALAALVVFGLAKEAATRYAVGVGALALMVAAVVGTFLYSLPAPQRPTSTETVQVDVGAASAPVVPDGMPDRAIEADVAPVASVVTGNAPVTAALLVLAWLTGVAGLSLRLATSWVFARRLVTRAVRPIASEIDARVKQLADRLALSKTVRVLESSAVAVPMIVGWLRPVVLVPVASLAGLSPAQVDALLAHELAHIRRHDALVNFLQAITETLLFYHPAIWWVSGRIRQEREYCCDDLAIAACGDRLVYATALADLAAIKDVPNLALAASGGSLADRVRRILGHPASSRSSIWLPVMLALLLVGGLVPIAATSPSALPIVNMIRQAASASLVPLSPTIEAFLTGQAPGAAADQTAAGPQRVTVRVIDGTTNEPLPGVSITLLCGTEIDASYFNIITGASDSNGEFVIDPTRTTIGEQRVSGPAKECWVSSASRQGFWANYALLWQRFAVGAGETVRTMPLWKLGSASGRVVDPQGRPIPGTRVRLLFGDRKSGGWSLHRVVLTNERGEFVLDGLQIPRGPVSGPTYTLAFPDLDVSEPVVPFAPNAGESRTGLEIRGVRRPTYRVTGRVTSPSGPADRVTVYLTDADPSLAAPATAFETNTYASADGGFAFADVPRGAYRLHVDTVPPNDGSFFRWEYRPTEVLWASMPLAVDRDRTGLVVAAQPGVEVHGRVVYEGESGVPAERYWRNLTFIPISGGRNRHEVVQADGAGQFRTASLLPGSYLIRSGLVNLTGRPWAGWKLSKVTAGGRDVTDEPYEISSAAVTEFVVTVTRRSTSISGVVREPDGRQATNATVIVFPTDPARWEPDYAGMRHRKRVETSDTGRYAVSELPPGEYFIVALPYADGLELDDAKFRQLSAIAQRIRLEYDTPVTRDLTFAAPATQTTRTFRVRIVDGLTREPVEGVGFNYSCFIDEPAGRRFVTRGEGTTDRDGEFVVAVAEPSACQLMNMLQPGYSQDLAENLRPTEITTGDATRVVRIWKMGSIAGHVLDADGRPLAGAALRLMSREPDPSADRAVPSTIVTTDERGAFSFGPISAIAYTFAMEDFELTEPRMAVALKPGESRTGLELRARPRLPFRVAGRVTTPSGTGVAAATVHLIREDTVGASPAITVEARADADGRFVFPRVLRGSYRIWMDDSSVWAEMPISITADMDNVVLVSRAKSTVSGIVKFDGEAPAGANVMLSVRRLSISDGAPGPAWMTSLSSSRPLLRPAADGSFSAMNLRPGRYVVGGQVLGTMNVPSGWMRESAMHGTQDVSIRPLELGVEPVKDIVITFTRQTTALEGVVRNAQGQGDCGVTVFVFPTDPALWDKGEGISRSVRAMLTDQHGRYAVRALPSGDYFVAAVATEDTIDSLYASQGLSRTANAEALLFRRVAPLATRVRIDFGTSVTQDLRRVALPPGSR